MENSRSNHNDLPFKKVDEGTILLVTGTNYGVISSYIHLCPQRIWEASKNYSVEEDIAEPSKNSWLIKK